VDKEKNNEGKVLPFCLLGVLLCIIKQIFYILHHIPDDDALMVPAGFSLRESIFKKDIHLTNIFFFLFC
jgi:hypothetical protein